MPAIHVRDVDDAVLEVLKTRAARNHRSLHAEPRDVWPTRPTRQVSTKERIRRVWLSEKLLNA